MWSSPPSLFPHYISGLLWIEKTLKLEKVFFGSCDAYCAKSHKDHELIKFQMWHDPRSGSYYSSWGWVGVNLQRNLTPDFLTLKTQLRDSCPPPSPNPHRMEKKRQTGLTRSWGLKTRCSVMTDHRGRPLAWCSWLAFCRCWKHHVTRRVLQIQLNTRFLHMLEESRLMAFCSE